MSSYGNGYFYGNNYLDMYLPPPTLNVVNVTNSPVIIKCEGQNDVLNAANVPVVNNRVDETTDLVKVTNVPATNCNELVKNDVNSHHDDEEEDNSQEVDIVINNVVSSFNVRCHLNLRQIALKGANVEYRRENGMVTMKLRKPYITASIWSSGKITCTGATSDEDAKTASRKIARVLHHLGFKVRFTNYRVVNVLATCIMYFGINLIKFAEKYRGLVCYEPELHPGATYRIKELRATLKVFTTGSITVIAPSIRNAQLAIEHIFPLVEEFKTAKPPGKNNKVLPPPQYTQSVKRKREEDANDSLSDEENVDNLPELPDSDDSWD